MSEVFRVIIEGEQIMREYMLRDPGKIETAIIEDVPLEGVVFPSDPDDQQIFRLVQDIEGYCKGVYRYNATDWVRIGA